MTVQSKIRVCDIEQSVPEFAGVTRATRAALLLKQRSFKTLKVSGQAVYSLLGKRKQKICRLGKLTSLDSIIEDQIQGEITATPIDVTGFAATLQEIAPGFVEKIMGVTYDWMNPALYTQLGISLLAVMINLIQLFRHRDSGLDITLNIISLSLNITQLLMVVGMIAGIDTIRKEVKEQVNIMLTSFIDDTERTTLTTREMVNNMQANREEVVLTNVVQPPIVKTAIDLPQVFSSAVVSDQIRSDSLVERVETQIFEASYCSGKERDTYKFPLEFYSWMEDIVEKRGVTVAFDKEKIVKQQLEKYVGRAVDVTQGKRAFSSHVETIYRTYNLVAYSQDKTLKFLHNCLLETVFSAYSIDKVLDMNEMLTFTKRIADKHEFLKAHVTLTPALISKKIQKGDKLQGMPGIDVLIKIACGLVATVITLVDISRGTSIAKRLVLANATKKAISENITDVRDIVESISYDVFGYNLSSDAQIILDIEEIRTQIERSLMRDNPYYVSHQPEFYEFKECLKRAKIILTSHQSKSNQLKSALANHFRLLESVVTRAQIVVEKVATAIFSMASRQEPVAILITGLPGAGKTVFASSWLTPQIQRRMGYSKNTYSINFGENHHWPIYNGAEVGIYDEFLARKSADPIIPEMNAICSSGSFNMAAAAVEYKMQPCRLKLLTMIANQFYVPLGDVLSPAASNAFYSRFLNFAFILKSQDVASATEGKQCRAEIQHAKNFEDDLIEIRQYVQPPGQGKISYAETPQGTDTMRLNPPYKIITKQQMLDMICKVLNEKEEEHRVRQQILETVDDEVQGTVDNVAYAFLGEPGSGKSVSALKIARELAVITQLPVCEVHADTVLSNVILLEPHIIVTHDAIYNELNFNGFYDRVPKPSIFINTANLRVTMMRPTNAEQQQEEMSYVNMSLNWLQSLRKTSLGITSRLLINSAPGWIRRIGLVGQLQHRGNESFRPEMLGGLYSFKAYKKYAWGGDKFDNATKSDGEIVQEIFRKYSAVVREDRDLIIREVNEFSISEITYDCVVAAESAQQLAQTVNNPRECVNAYFRGTKSDALPHVKVSSRLLGSNFKFNPTQFRMREGTTNKEQLLEMASTSFSFLKLSNKDHTCNVKAGSLEARCKGNTIEYKLRDDMESHCILERHGSSVILTRMNAVGESIMEGRYDLQEVCKGLENGFQHTLVVNVEHIKIIVEQFDGLCNDPVVDALRKSAQLRSLNAGVVLEQVSAFNETWAIFKESKLYTLVCVVLCVVGSSVLLTLLVNLLSLFIKKDEPTIVLVDGLPTEVIYGETVCKLEWTRKSNKKFDVVVDPNEPVDIDDDTLHDILRRLVKYKVPDGKLDTVAVLCKQSDPDEDEMTKKGGKRIKSSRLKDKNARYVVKEWGTTNGELGEQFATITAQLDRNMCRVQTDVSSVFGIMVKERICMTTPHVYRGATTINVKKYGKDWKAKVIYTDPSNEVGLLEIIDETFPYARDITSKFIQHKDLCYVYQTQLRVPNREITSFTNTCGTSDVSRMHVPIRLSGVVCEQHWYTMMVETQGPVTRNGECGSLLLAATNNVGSGIVIGQHFALCGSSHTRSSVITREYLDNILLMARKIKYTNIQSEQENAVQGDKVLVLKTDSAFFGGVDVERVMDEDTGVWFDSLEELEIYEDEDLFYDVEEECGSLLNHMLPLGFDKKCTPSWKMKNNIKPTPWQASIIEELPLMKLPAPLKLADVRDRSQLVRVNDNQSILFTQLVKMNKYVEWSPEQREHLTNAAAWLSSEYRTLYRVEHRPLTMLENINGLIINPREHDLYSHLEGLEQDSSGGYLLQRLYKQTDKHGLFKEKFSMPNGKMVYDWNDTSLAQNIRLRTTKMEELAIQQTRMVLPVRDSLKVETLKLSKVEVGATRVFQACDVSEAMLFRKYTGTMQAVMKARRKEGHCQVGVDPFVGFTEIYQRFLKVGTQGESGDFTNWDKPLRAALISAAFDVWLDTVQGSWKGNKEELQKVYVVLRDCLIHTLSVGDGIVYFSNIGMPSGTPVTASLNSTANDLLRYMCLSYIVKRHNTAKRALEDNFKEWCLTEYGQWLGEMNNFVIIDEIFIQKNLDHVTYGDDIFSVVSYEYSWMFNFEAYKKAYAYFGVAYDTTSKDGSSYKTVELDTLSFMSRTMSVIPGTNVVLPALKRSSVVGHLHWTRHDTISQYRSNIQACLDEARYHDEEFYNQIVRCIEIIQKKIPQLRIIIPNYKRQQITINSIAYLGRGIIQADFNDKSVKRNNENVTDNIENQSSSIRSNESIKMQSTNGITIEEAHNFMERLNFSKAEVIKEYRAFPALVEIPLAGKEYFSVGFDAVRFDSEAVTKVISDLAHALSDVEQDELKVKPLVYTACMRRLPTGDAWCWQIHFDIQRHVSKENMSRNKTIEGVTFSQGWKAKETCIIQATGTEETAMFNGSNDAAIADATFQDHTVANKAITIGLYDKDITTLKSMSMQVQVIPVAMGSAMGTIIKQITYGNRADYHPAMLAWSKLHSRMNGPEFHTFEIVAPSTVVEQFLIGITMEVKSSYEPWELQLIEWKAESATQGIWRTFVDLASVTGNIPAWTDFIDTAPIGTKRPTVVVMTRVPIQNSYANDGVSVQIIHQANFGKNTRFVTLPADLLPEPTGYNSNSQQVTLSKALGTEGPLYICTDGDVLGNAVKGTSLLERIPSKMNLMRQTTIFPLSGSNTMFDSNTTDTDKLTSYTDWSFAIGAWTAKVDAPPAGEEQMDSYFGYRTEQRTVTTERPDSVYIWINPSGLITTRNITMGNDNLLAFVEATKRNVSDANLNITDSIVYEFPNPTRSSFEQIKCDLANTFPGGYGMAGRMNRHFGSQPWNARIPSRVLIIVWEVYGLGLDFSYIFEFEHADDCVTGVVSLHASPAEEFPSLAMLGYVNPNIQLADMTINEMQLLTFQASTVEKDILAPDFANLKFTQMIPPSVPRVMAGSGRGTVFNDPSFLSHWERYCTDVLGIDVATSWYVSFKLMSSTSPSTVASVLYSTETRLFQIRDNHGVAINSYKVYPKTAYSEVLLSEVQVSQTQRGIASTATTAWANRTYDAGYEVYFDGKNMVDERTRAVRLAKKLEAMEFLKPTSIVQAMVAGMIGGGLLQGLGAGIAGAAQASKDLKMQQKSLAAQMAMLEMSLKNASGMQKEQLQAQRSNLEYQIAENFANQTKLQEYAQENNLELKDKDLENDKAKLAITNEQEKSLLGTKNEQEEKMIRLKAELNGVSTPAASRYAGVGYPVSTDRTMPSFGRGMNSDFIYGGTYSPTPRDAKTFYNNKLPPKIDNFIGESDATNPKTYEAINTSIPRNFGKSMPKLNMTPKFAMKI